MDKRKEMKDAFNPEKINYEAVIKCLDWSKEITPVDLVKAVNSVEGLKGRMKYETNEKSFGLLIKYFEKKVGDLVTKRISGKDRFYTIKPEYNSEQLVHFARTGEILVVREELKKKKDSKFYLPEPGVKAKTSRKTFPDNESLAKTIVVMGLLLNQGGEFKTSEYKKFRDKFGWRSQRSVEGAVYTNFQEAKKVADWLEFGDMFSISPAKVKLTNPSELSELGRKIKDVAALMDDFKLKDEVLHMIKPDIETEVKEEVVEEKTKSPTPLPKPKTLEVKPIPAETRHRVIKTSPVVGKSEFREIETAASSMIYESSKTRWYKSLIASVLKGAGSGAWYSYNDISSIIKKTRFADVPNKDIRMLIGEINKCWSGIFKDISSYDYEGGIIIKDEAKLAEFVSAYPAEKITEIIFMRLHMDIKELNDTYPELKFKIASVIGERDNIYEIETNRSEKGEKAFAKLVFRMRQGEIVLESPQNWTMKRTRILIERLFGNI